jgi:hypothetical protein
MAARQLQEQSRRDASITRNGSLSRSKNKLIFMLMALNVRSCLLFWLLFASSKSQLSQRHRGGIAAFYASCWCTSVVSGDQYIKCRLLPLIEEIGRRHEEEMALKSNAGRHFMISTSGSDVDIVKFRCTDATHRRQSSTPGRATPRQAVRIKDWQLQAHWLVKSGAPATG